MAFVAEKISDQDRFMFESFGLRSPLRGEAVPASEWVIDRKREAFLVALAGQSLESSEIATSWGLVWQQAVIRFETSERCSGRYWKDAVKRWRITQLAIPQKMQPQTEVIIEMIKEALIDSEADRIEQAHFEEIVSPRFVPEAG